MRTSNDAIRSIKKYLAVALGSDWEIRSWTDEGTFAPPLARVSESSPTVFAHRRVFTDATMGVQVHCYLAPAKSTSSALHESREVDDLLVQAFEVGVGLARPRRIPLYDYDGVHEDATSEARNYYDYLRVLDFAVNRVQDADDPNVVVTIADFRITWPRQTTVDPGDKTVNSLRVEERAS